MFDFGVGYSELFVLALVAVIVIGPKDLPKVLRTFGQMMSKARGMAREFQTHVDAAMKDAGVAELKKDIGSLKTAMSTPSIASPLAPASPQASMTKEFSGYFGDAAQPGETRVAGKRVEQEVT